MADLNSKVKFSVFLAADKESAEKLMKAFSENKILHIYIEIETEFYAGKTIPHYKNEFITQQQFLEMQQSQMLSKVISEAGTIDNL